MNLKNAIYPTIKKKFDKLTSTYIPYVNRFNFVDDEMKIRLVYDRTRHIIIIDMDYFMLRYFGIDSSSYNEDVSGTFMEILKDYLGDKHYNSKISHNDVYYTTLYN